MTPEPYLFGILTILGSYLLSVAVVFCRHKKKDSLKNFKPFNLKKHGRKQD
jgi:hypothetical protein